MRVLLVLVLISYVLGHLYTRLFMYGDRNAYKYDLYKICIIMWRDTVTFNPLPQMPVVNYFNPAGNDDINVKNIDKWGYNFLIE